jgi:hypothetical protein
MPGCIGTSVGNPPGVEASEVKLSVVRSDDIKAMVHALGSRFTIDEAWIALGDIELLDSGRCAKSDDEDEEIDFRGPSAADLLAGMVYPMTPHWRQMADQEYCALRVSVRASEQPIEGTPAELQQYGVFVRGTRGDGTPFEVRTEVDEALKLAATGKQDFTLEGGPVGLLIAFNVSSWINASLLDQAEVKNGVIEANKSQNAAIAESARKAIPMSARLVKDKNRNGVLDAEDSEL